jgi:hypothetical protein
MNKSLKDTSTLVNISIDPYESSFKDCGEHTLKGGRLDVGGIGILSDGWVPMRLGYVCKLCFRFHLVFVRSDVSFHA